MVDYLTIRDREEQDKDDRNNDGMFYLESDISPRTTACVTSLVAIEKAKDDNGTLDGTFIDECIDTLETLKEMYGGSKSDTESNNEGSFVSKDHFSNHLTSGQDALLRVLLEEEGGEVPSDVALERMENTYGHNHGNTRAIGGIIAGLSKKYGNDVCLSKSDDEENTALIWKKNVPGRKAYWLNLDYEGELRDALQRTGYSNRQLP